MKRLRIIWIAAGLIAIMVSSGLAEPTMNDVESRDDWKPHKHYKNLIDIRIVESLNPNDDWDIGILMHKHGEKPVTQGKRPSPWINGAPYYFELSFTKATGQVDFDIYDYNEGGEYNEPVISLSHIMPQYAGRGMDEIHVEAHSYYIPDEYWTYTFLTNLQLNGESHDFNEIRGPGNHTYATISGLDCNDYVLTGDMYCSWIGKMAKKKHQATIRFGEACDPQGDIEEPNAPPVNDLTGDCYIDFNDFAILAGYWLQDCNSPGWCEGSDFDESQLVDRFDMNILAENWLVKKYGGGCGTEELPYLIYTDKQLNTIGVNPNDWDAHFLVMADIDLSEHTGNSFNIIGAPEAPFTGVFDGNKHTISFFTQGDADQNEIGLFRDVNDPNAVIKNVWLDTVTIVTKNPDYAGGLVGRLENGLIYNCQLLSGEIVGYEGMPSTTGSNYIGGLVGYSGSGGSIVECSVDCNVYGYNMTGGLVGCNKGLIERCLALGNGIELMAHDNVGVKGWDKVGGLTGLNSGGTVSNSYSQKCIHAHDKVGGLIGESYNGFVEKCYSTGHVTENSDDRGGLIGLMTGVVNDSFWDIDTGGIFNDNGVGIPKTTAEMQTESTFTSAGWDFTTPVWLIYENIDYPLFWWFTRPRPNPMRWASLPGALSGYTVTMTATIASAYDSNGVEYYFNNVTDSNHDSGWQVSEVYMDSGLEPESTYTYRVKVRDNSPGQNETEYSAEASVVTLADNTPPEPYVMTWDMAPEATGPNSILMIAVTATDEGGVEYYFKNLTDSNHDSGWQDSREYTDTGLEDLTQYAYIMKARDKSAGHNETAWSIVAYATTEDGTPPEPNPMTWALEPAVDAAFTIIMTATTAYDTGSSVEYFFHNVTDSNHDSGWQSSNYYADTGLLENTQYTYMVKARDTSVNYNATAYSAEASATTEFDLTPPEPDPMTWASEPNALSPFRITMTATTAFDETGVEYFFQNVNDVNHNSNWQDSSIYVDTGLSPSTEYSYKVKARNKSANQGETQYSNLASATTYDQASMVQEDCNFVSIGGHDGRLWNNGPGTPGYGANSEDADSYALRLGDYSGGLTYKTILSFDTSFLPGDCEILSATLVMTRSSSFGVNPFSWGGACNIDIANPYFGTDAALDINDYNAPASATAIATFPEDPGWDEPMISSEFNAAGKSTINTDGLTQFRVYFEVETNGSGSDFLTFYSGEYPFEPKRPRLVLVYATHTRLLECVSIAAEDGSVWDANSGGIGVGHDADDSNEAALRLGDESLGIMRGYRVILSFDTSGVPEDKLISSAHVAMTRGALVGVDPFTWGGSCRIDVASPYFGSSSALEDSDFEASATADNVAAFSTEAGDPQAEGKMLSTSLNSEGLATIDTEGGTQLKIYFEVPNNGDAATDYLGFYSGNCAIEPKRPRLLIRYKDY